MAEQDRPGRPEGEADALLERMAALVAEHRLAELSVEEDGLLIRVRGVDSDVSPFPVPGAVMPPPVSVPALPPPILAPAAAGTGNTPAAVSRAKSANRLAQESPMVGVYYRSPSPEDPPFINVGDLVSVGQTVGLIEAMKVYSELPSEVAGRVVEIAVQNGKLVQQGQPLFYVEPVQA